MLPGRDVIYPCPECDQLCSKRSLLSGNTLGSRLYSDGFRRARMLPLLPNLVACPHCRALWLSDARQPLVGPDDSVDDVRKALAGWRGSRRGLRDLGLERIREPTEGEYYLAINRGLGTTPEDEADLRLRAWWLSNDPFRPPDHPRSPNPTDRPAAWRENLLALRELGHPEMTDYPLVAEINRELGLLPEAIEALDREWDPDILPLVDFIRALCRGRQTRVVAFPPGF